MNTETIKSIVNKNVRLRNKLFASGFYFTDAKVDKEDYPFYNIWNKEEIKNYKHTKNREKAENIYYTVNSFLPF